MAIRSLRFDNDPILKKRCKEVSVVDNRVRQQLADMLETLRHTENGAALAANQVGLLKRLVVVEYCGQVLQLINPEIVEASGVQECVEGCLSFPGRFVRTIRPQKVTLQALDERGEAVLITGEGELAKCFCHELDHLEGKTLLDRAVKDSSGKICAFSE